MLVIFPSPRGLYTKEDSMRKWSKKHKNYIQLQVTVKGLGGQGTQGSCSLHSFLTNLFLPHLNDSLKSEWPVQERGIHTPSPPPTHIGKFIRHSLWAKCPAYQNLRGDRAQEDYSSHPAPLCGNEGAAFSKLQAKPGITGHHNPFPPPVRESALLLLIT